MTDSLVEVARDVFFTFVAPHVTPDFPPDGLVRLRIVTLSQGAVPAKVEVDVASGRRLER